MPWYWGAIIVIAGLLFLMAIGMPLSFAFCVVGTAGAFFLVGEKALFIVAQLAHNTLAEFILITIPLFIFMAEMLYQGGFTVDLYRAFEKWLGRLPGGLAMATIASCAAFSTVCGSSYVTAATIGKIALPELSKRGYSKTLLSGTIAAGGTLGILIPPSIPFILYGYMSDTSIGQLFMAGVIPGFLLAFLFMVLIFVWVIISPAGAPLGKSSSLKERLVSLIHVWPVIVTGLLVLSSIYLGVATVAEAAAVGCVLSLIGTFAYKRMPLKNIIPALTRTVYTTGWIVLLLVGAKTLSYVLSMLGTPRELASFVTSMGSPILVLIATYVLLTIMGMFLEGMAILVLTVPVFVPMLSALGFDPIWFGIILTIFIELALLTPPVGMNVFVVADISRPYDIKINQIFVGIAPFCIALLLLVVLLTIFPSLALWLPGTMMG